MKLVVTYFPSTRNDADYWHQLFSSLLRAPHKVILSQGTRGQYRLKVYSLDEDSRLALYIDIMRVEHIIGCTNGSERGNNHEDTQI